MSDGYTSSASIDVSGQLNKLISNGINDAANNLKTEAVVIGNSIYINSTNKIVFKNDVSIKSETDADLTNGGALNLKGFGLVVYENINIGGNIISYNTNDASNLSTGALVVPNGSFISNGDLSIGNIILEGNLNVIGNIIVTNQMNVIGSVIISNSMIIDGSLNVNTDSITYILNCSDIQNINEINTNTLNIEFIIDGSGISIINNSGNIDTNLLGSVTSTTLNTSILNADTITKSPIKANIMIYDDFTSNIVYNNGLLNVMGNLYMSGNIDNFRVSNLFIYGNINANSLTVNYFNSNIGILTGNLVTDSFTIFQDVNTNLIDIIEKIIIHNQIKGNILNMAYNLNVSNNLFVYGTKFEIKTINMNIKDNIIIINHGNPINNTGFTFDYNILKPAIIYRSTPLTLLNIFPSTNYYILGNVVGSDIDRLFGFFANSIQGNLITGTLDIGNYTSNIIIGNTSGNTFIYSDFLYNSPITISNITGYTNINTNNLYSNILNSTNVISSTSMYIYPNTVSNILVSNLNYDSLDTIKSNIYTINANINYLTINQNLISNIIGIKSLNNDITTINNNLIVEGNIKYLSMNANNIIVDDTYTDFISINDNTDIQIINSNNSIITGNVILFTNTEKIYVYLNSVNINNIKRFKLLNSIIKDVNIEMINGGVITLSAQNPYRKLICDSSTWIDMNNKDFMSYRYVNDIYSGSTIISLDCTYNGDKILIGTNGNQYIYTNYNNVITLTNTYSYGILSAINYNGYYLGIVYTSGLSTILDIYRNNINILAIILPYTPNRMIINNNGNQIIISTNNGINMYYTSNDWSTYNTIGLVSPSNLGYYIRFIKNTLLVSDPTNGNGIVYMYDTSNNTLNNIYIFNGYSDNGSFGYSFDATLDLSIVIIGALLADNNIGKVYIYKQFNGQYTLIQVLQSKNYIGSVPRQGSNINITENGDNIYIGSYTDNNNVGCTYIWKRKGNTWYEDNKILINGYTNQGNINALSKDGKKFYMGSSNKVSYFN